MVLIRLLNVTQMRKGGLQDHAKAIFRCVPVRLADTLANNKILSIEKRDSFHSCFGIVFSGRIAVSFLRFLHLCFEPTVHSEFHESFLLLDHDAPPLFSKLRENLAGKIIALKAIANLLLLSAFFLLL